MKNELFWRKEIAKQKICLYVLILLIGLTLLILGIGSLVVASEEVELVAGMGGNGFLFFASQVNYLSFFIGLCLTFTGLFKSNIYIREYQFVKSEVHVLTDNAPKKTNASAGTYCPSCNIVIPKNFKTKTIVCPRCGREYNNPHYFSSQSTPPSTNIICPKCNAKIPRNYGTNTVKCEKCGTVYKNPDFPRQN